MWCVGKGVRGVGCCGKCYVKGACGDGDESMTEPLSLNASEDQCFCPICSSEQITSQCLDEEEEEEKDEVEVMNDWIEDRKMINSDGNIGLKAFKSGKMKETMDGGDYGWMGDYSGVEDYGSITMNDWFDINNIERTNEDLKKKGKCEKKIRQFKKCFLKSESYILYKKNKKNKQKNKNDKREEFLTNDLKENKKNKKTQEKFAQKRAKRKKNIKNLPNEESNSVPDKFCGCCGDVSASTSCHESDDEETSRKKVEENLNKKKITDVNVEKTCSPIDQDTGFNSKYPQKHYLSLPSNAEDFVNSDHHSKVCKHLQKRIKNTKKKCKKNVKKSKKILKTQRQKVPVSVALLCVLLYLLLGSVIFKSIEGWSGIVCVYFCFVTLSTIGLYRVLMFFSKLFYKCFVFIQKNEKIFFFILIKLFIYLCFICILLFNSIFYITLPILCY